MAGKKLRPGKTGHTLRRKEPWEMDSVIDALFAFHKNNKRWPFGWEWKSLNGLPSPWKTVRLVNPRYYYPQPETERVWVAGTPWRRPWDVFQVEIAKDERCKTPMVFQLTNALARKEAIQRIGFKNLVKETPGARCISSKERFGELWQLPGERTDTQMHIVKVVNRTAEPDGTFAEYFLRVPPYIWDVQRALAWTFGLDQRKWEGGRSLPLIDYRPLVET